MRKLSIAFALFATLVWYSVSAGALDLGRGLKNIGKALEIGKALDNAAGGVVVVPAPQPSQQQEYYPSGTSTVTEAPQPSQPTEEAYWLDSDPDKETAGMDEDNGDEGDDLFGADTSGDEESGGITVGGGKGSGGGASDTIEVVATGIGKDSDGALRNALRAAVEQAVGTMVDSETLAENDEIVNDQILSYSAGFVQSHKVIGKPTTRDGLVTIKINAIVKKTELTEKLEAASVHVTEVDGEDLFGEAVTKIEQNQASGEIVKKAFEGFPHNVLEIRRVDKPSYDERNKKWIIKVEISINKEKYRTFVRKLLPVLEKIATNRGRVTMSRRSYSNYEGALNFEGMNNYLNSWIFLIGTQVNDARTTSIWEFYRVPEEAIIGAQSVIKRAKFTVDIIDKNKDIITSGTYNSPRPYMLFREGNRPTPVITFPLLNDPDRGGSLDSLNPGTEKITYNLSFDISPNEFKRMSNVVCRIDK
ncbi:MAG: hypothetical protein LBU64_06315 [Planctomycetota bacterium]|jgi:hypothetical protein|nr:hypothetical protein [Planctomycetota bacterium]